MDVARRAAAVADAGRSPIVPEERRRHRSARDAAAGARRLAPPAPARAACARRGRRHLQPTRPAQIRLNRWQGAFYEAIEQRHVAAFMTQLMVFAVIAGGSAGAGRQPDLAAGDDQRTAARVAHPRPSRPVAGPQTRLHAELRGRDRRQSRSAHPAGRPAPDRAHRPSSRSACCSPRCCWRASRACSGSSPTRSSSISATARSRSRATWSGARSPTRSAARCSPGTSAAR